MKRIYLVRHANALPREDFESDHARELTGEGDRDARRLGRFLSATDQIPDRIVTSTAVRARATAAELPEGGQWMTDVPVREARSLYECDAEDVLDEIRTTGADARSVLLVGHQPAWGAAARQLAGDANVNLPPCTCVRIDIDTDDWASVEFGDGRMDWLLPPHLLR